MCIASAWLLVSYFSSWYALFRIPYRFCLCSMITYFFYLFRPRSKPGEHAMHRCNRNCLSTRKTTLLPQVPYPHPNRNLQPTPSLALITLTLTQATSEINRLKSLPLGLRTGVRCMWVWSDIIQLLMDVVCGIFYVFYDILHVDIHI